MSDKPATGEWTALRAQLVKEGLPEDHINQIIDGMNRDIQSKPATGEHAEWCIGGVKGPCNCKSASGEWTEIVDRADKELEDTVSNFLAGLGYESGKIKEIILRAINAALAATEEKYENATDNLYRDIKHLNQQLAAIDDFFRDQGGSFMVEGDTTFKRVQNYTQELDGRIDDLEKQLVMNEGIEEELREANQSYYDCEVKLADERESLTNRHKLCVDYEMKWKAEQEKSRILGNMIDGLPGIPGFRENLKLHQAEFDRLSAIIEKDTLRIVELEEQLAAERKTATPVAVVE